MPKTKENNMKQPKVSIVVPIYGVEKYLNQCVDSILAQTLKDIEIILVDDGSKDRCPQIVDEYAKKDPRIVAIHQPNGGYGRAVNHGMEVATGEYLGIVEPDDFIEPDMYEKMYQSARENNTDITKTSFYNRSEFSGAEEPANWEYETIPHRVFTVKECGYFLYTHPSIWSCIYRRKFLEENHIRMVEPKGAGWADNPFQVQTMCLAKRINFVNKPFYHYRKFNPDESDDLKDYKIPFDRSAEIHNWLEQNKISDGNILEYLYKRELAYIQIVLRMKKIDNKEDCYTQIETMVSRWNFDLIRNSTLITKHEKHAMEKLRKNVKGFDKKLHSTQYKNGKKITRYFGGIIKKAKNEKSKKVYLFGVQIYHHKR
jgi:glycosyltransferase involved in cell wall biosynthesis